MAITDELFNHTKLFSKTLKKCCEPLGRYFGTTEVGLFYITAENTMINIHTNEAWIEHCMVEKYYLDDPHIADPSKMGTGFTVNTSCLSEDFTQGLLRDAIDSYDMCHGVSYAKRGDPGYFALTFDTNKENVTMPNAMLQDQSCIVLFAEYLQQELAPVFKKLGNHAIDLTELKGDKFKTQQVIVEDKEKLRRKISFLKELGVIGENENVDLSPQERKCVHHYLNGKTAEDTAAEMGLTPGTVQHYFVNIKNKLNIERKKELHNKATLLKSLNIINQV